MKKRIPIAIFSLIALTATAGSLALNPEIAGKESFGSWPIHAFLCAIIVYCVAKNYQNSTETTSAIMKVVEHAAQSQIEFGMKIVALTERMEEQGKTTGKILTAIQFIAANCSRCNAMARIENDEKGGAE